MKNGIKTAVCLVLALMACAAVCAAAARKRITQRSSGRPTPHSTKRRTIPKESISSSNEPFRFIVARAAAAVRASFLREKIFGTGIDIYIVCRYNQLTIYREPIYRTTMEVNNMPGTPALTEATYYILLSLYRPRHGYGIMQQTEELSGGRVRLAAGTLYGALNTLCDKGWIVLKTVDEDRRRKEYLLTDKGREILINEVKRLKELARNGEMILGEEL